MSSKVILITGASSGIGLATLKRLVSDGHTVYGTGRGGPDLDVIKHAGGHPLAMEMTDEGSIEAALKTLLGKENKIDVLFNNAGYGLYGSVEDVPLDAARHQFEVNLFGLARLTQLVIPHMRAASSGTIINTSSMGGKVYTPFGSWYHATKHALEGWSDCLRLELKPFGIAVVIIEPGIIKTKWSGVMRDNLLKYSGSGPYKTYVRRVADRTQSVYKNTSASDPDVIANVVSKAVTARKPKTRYAAGKYARLLIFVRTKLGDRVFDAVIDR